MRIEPLTSLMAASFSWLMITAALAALSSAAPSSAEDTVPASRCGDLIIAGLGFAWRERRGNCACSAAAAAGSSEGDLDMTRSSSINFSCCLSLQTILEWKFGRIYMKRGTFRAWRRWGRQKSLAVWCLVDKTGCKMRMHVHQQPLQLHSTVPASKCEMQPAKSKRPLIAATTMPCQAKEGWEGGGGGQTRLDYFVGQRGDDVLQAYSGAGVSKATPAFQNETVSEQKMKTTLTCVRS
jgi:hypothetical protein